MKPSPSSIVPAIVFAAALLSGPGTAAAAVVADGVQCPPPSSGVRIVDGNTDICPTSVDQVLREQDPADVPLSLALMGGAMLCVLFMGRRRR